MADQQQTLDDIFGPQSLPNKQDSSSAQSLDDIFGPSTVNNDAVKNNNSGIIQRTGADVAQRMKNLQDIQDQVDAGKINPASGFLQRMGEVAGAATIDPTTEMAKSVGQYVPDFINNAAKGAGDWATENIAKPIGENVVAPTDSFLKKFAPGYSSYSKSAQDINTNHPELSADIRSAVNVGSILPAGKAIEAGGDFALGKMGSARELLNDYSDSLGSKEKITVGEAKKSGDIIKDMSQQIFDKAQEHNQSFDNNFITGLINKAKATEPQTIWGKATVGENDASKIIRQWEKNAAEGHPLDLNSLQEMDAGINDKISDHFVNGKGDSDAKSLLDLKSALRNHVQDTGGPGVDYLNDARALWAEKSKMDLLDKIETKAGVSDNQAAIRKRAYGSLLQNGNAMNMFSPEERTLIKEASKTGVATNLLREAGSRLTATITGAAAGSGAGPVGTLMGAVAGHVVAAGAREGANYFGSQAPKKLAEGIMKRANEIHAKSMSRIPPSITGKALVPVGSVVNHMTDDQIAAAQARLRATGRPAAGNGPSGGPIATAPTKYLPSPQNMGPLPSTGMSDAQVAHEQAALRATGRQGKPLTDISPSIDEFGTPTYKKSGGPIKSKIGVLGRFKRK